MGPSVIWRFVTQPTAKSAALLLAASRRELTEKSATRRNCLIRACLSLDTIDALADWREWQPLDAALPEVAYPPLTPSTFSEGEEELRPAVLALQVALAAGLASQDAEGIVWNMPERQGGDESAPRCSHDLESCSCRSVPARSGRGNASAVDLAQADDDVDARDLIAFGRRRKLRDIDR